MSASMLYSRPQEASLITLPGNLGKPGLNRNSQTEGGGDDIASLVLDRLETSWEVTQLSLAFLGLDACFSKPGHHAVRGPKPGHL